jgi:glutamate formiminotransferase
MVQVSMNLTNYRLTSLPRAFAAVAAEARRAGVEVRDSEIIGLVPAAAMTGVDPGTLRLRGFSPDQVLENRL